ncbi:IclR family transcriptional regulator [Loktanella salsilacus]|mgnify:CR=1 FL=1|jgi:DNA-binding IclR family transcriptional regulator|uniref:DNA-binding transcriptional regulator, IclR family n=2 Tax=Loktanella salsilacus TaxID=195913 RepID=A0A1I4GFS8_9RHOB|nr:IclR family transcriptional regulator [Loktanella salsilacus]MBU0862819.1 IclR family transcriptional regulator [Alphaproteobacteria bacterium]UTH43378.1 IclR family transcriptional regulator [Loktanella salsilacus]UTH47085.1 IclR family transcriptional regulator [Loktanella salsilacus]SFL28021.1 DNA-binding transcriptional regulator, IclR family [Loktanella salsilacus]|tara:strand:+ start:196 stop:1005 length:810 start_codon:yes stop_codon:yes gene_type:complete
MDGDLEKDRRFATTLARGLSVLRAFRPSDDGLGNAEISDRTGLPKSTVSRLTFTLQSLGYLTHTRRHDRYRPGPALLALGNMASASLSFVDLSGPLMQRLADETGTLSLLLVRDAGKMLIVKTWRPRGVASLWLEVGHRLPFNGTSSGHAMLGALPVDGFAQAVRDAAGDRGLTPDQAHVNRDLAQSQIQTRGYVITDPDSYFAANIHAVAVPFQSRELGDPVVFTCGAMPEALSVARMREEVGPKLLQTVRDLERMMGQSSGMSAHDL